MALKQGGFLKPITAMEKAICMVTNIMAMVVQKVKKEKNQLNGQNSNFMKNNLYPVHYI